MGLLPDRDDVGFFLHVYVFKTIHSPTAALERAVEQAMYGSCAVALDINWRPTFW